MALTQATLGAGRIGLKKLFALEMDQIPKAYIDVVGRTEKTTQTYEVFKQYAGLGPADQTPEGKRVKFDDLAPLNVITIRPIMYTKGVQMSPQTKFTDQYGKLKGLTPQIAMAFVERRNLNGADLDNSGFTDTTKGVGTETLYSGSHQLGSVYMSNRPLAVGQVPGASPATIELSLGPLTIEWAWKDLRRQVSARNLPMFPRGKLDIKVPPELYIPACRALKAVKLAGSNNNDPNVVSEFFNDPKNIDYYTSSTAWFIKASDPKYHGLYLLEQMPYDIELLAKTDDLMHKWAAYESWAYGWIMPHGVWGTQGA